MNQKIKIALTIGALVVAVFIYLAFSKHDARKPYVDNQTLPSQSTPSPTSPSPSLESNTNSSPPIEKRKLDINYSDLAAFEFWDGINGNPDLNSPDQYVIARYRNSDAQVVIPSTKTAFPEIFTTTSNNQVVKLRIFQSLSNNQILIIEPYTLPGYKSTKMLFRYNTQSGEVKRLAVSDFLFQSFDQTGLDNMGMPVNSKKLIFIPNLPKDNGLNQIMYVVDLNSDSYREFQRLSGDKTYNAGSYQKPVFDIIPQPTGTLRVAIFLNSLKNPSYNPNTDKGKTILETYEDLTVPHAN